MKRSTKPIHYYVEGEYEEKTDKRVESWSR